MEKFRNSIKRYLCPIIIITANAYNALVFLMRQEAKSDQAEGMKMFTGVILSLQKVLINSISQTEKYEFSPFELHNHFIHRYFSYDIFVGFPFCRTDWLFLSLEIINSLSCSSGYTTAVTKIEVVAPIIELLGSPHPKIVHAAVQTLEIVSSVYVPDVSDHVIGEELIDSLCNLIHSNMPVKTTFIRKNRLKKVTSISFF